ncbi:ketosteroid isomerase protein [Marine Group I thaumarchaeote SCGC AAA799-E16]|uniref:Ketosteroid isomerase protein n=4 Tax=Marine Group I TaxID=905826 RepID=A0A081RPC8_9ARCH|nr:ketosteroid isomerase protein [Marine Group I thaumarchaeote SCGC AAA799-N04]KER06579.1 ketosteroid isomerase protein [Marine Group I thaumarchaeote SCGC AAA799-E16]KFM16107.1 ketosteroid isomerase protein [Marine Group I thaumarchaeote SCGC AAA799-D11]KFM17844.1 ketosteroid isomerase protein [Marine Group I thaumarchaeote SCGC RSA3]
MSNQELIKNFYISFQNKETDFSDFCHENIEWITMDDMPNGGIYVGIKSVFEDYFPKMLSNFKEFHALPERFLDFKDHVMVVGKYHGISNTNKEFTITFSHVYLIQDKKIVQFRQFTDSQKIQESLT